MILGKHVLNLGNCLILRQFCVWPRRVAEGRTYAPGGSDGECRPFSPICQCAVDPSSPCIVLAQWNAGLTMTRVLRFTSRLWRALQTGQTLPGREALRSTVILFLSMLRERSSRSGPGPFPAVHFFANASQGRDQKNDHECCCCCHDNRSDHHPEHDSAVGHAHLRRHSLSGTSTRRIVAGSFVSRTITPTRLSDVGKGKEMRSRPPEISRLGRKCSPGARQSCSVAPFMLVELPTSGVRDRNRTSHSRCRAAGSPAFREPAVREDARPAARFPAGRIPHQISSFTSDGPARCRPPWPRVRSCRYRSMCPLRSSQSFNSPKNGRSWLTEDVVSLRSCTGSDDVTIEADFRSILERQVTQTLGCGTVHPTSHAGRATWPAVCFN